MQQSRIGWTDHTFNPWIGCTKVSPGCTHCYAERIAERFSKIPVWGPKAMRHLTSVAYWHQPLTWNRTAQRQGTPLRVFSGSMCDVFEDHPIADALRPRLFDLIAETPHLRWLLLTKRADRMADHLPEGWPWPHVWLGVSIETPAYLWRADVLREIPAALRFLSCEPLLADLGPINLDGIGWVIVGGESGRNYRPMDLVWMGDIDRQCRAAWVPTYIKQDHGLTDGLRGRIPDHLWHHDMPALTKAEDMQLTLV